MSEHAMAKGSIPEREYTMTIGPLLAVDLSSEMLSSIDLFLWHESLLSVNLLMHSILKSF